MKFLLTATICLIGISSIVEQKPEFTFWGNTAEGRSFFAWTGELGEQIKYRTDNVDDTKLLLSMEGFSEANIIMICDRTSIDELFESLKNHKQVRTLVIKSDYVSKRSISSIIDSCENLEKLSLDCPNVDISEIDFSSLNHLSLVYRGSGTIPLVQANLPKGGGGLELITVLPNKQ